MKYKFTTQSLTSVREARTNSSINLVALYQQHTYKSVLEGLPDARMNKEILNELETIPKKYFWNLKTYLLPYGLDTSIPEHPLLPPYFTACFLESDYEPDEDSTASGLCVLWLHENVNMAPSQILKEVVKRVDWAHQAEGFCH